MPDPGTVDTPHILRIVKEARLNVLSKALTDAHVSDEVYAEAKKEFSDEELIDLTLVVTTINLEQN